MFLECTDSTACLDGGFDSQVYHLADGLYYQMLRISANPFDSPLARL